MVVQFLGLCCTNILQALLGKGETVFWDTLVKVIFKVKNMLN